MRSATDDRVGRRRPRFPRIVWLLPAGCLLAGTALAASLSVASKDLTVYKTCVITLYPSTSTAAGTDSFVQQDHATNNYNSTTPMQVKSATTQNHRIYIQFDLTSCSPSIPSTATVKIATFRLYATNLASGCRTQDLFAVTSAWTASTITWNNQPFGTSLNNPASSQATSSINVGGGTCANGVGYVSGWDVTSDVQKFVAGTATNDGWMIRDDAEASSTSELNKYAGQPTNSVSEAPQLIITYV